MEGPLIPSVRPVAAISKPLGRRLHKTITTCCWVYPVFLLILWLVIRQLGDKWWPATLMMFGPRWASATPLPVLAGYALWRRSRLVWPVSAAVALQLFPIMGLCLPIRLMPARNTAVQTIRVLTLNAHGGQTSGPQLEALLAGEKPDIVLIQDWAKRMRLTFYNAPGWYTRWDADRELFVASRFPIVNGQDLDLEDLGPEGLDVPGRETAGECAEYVLQTPGGPITVFNVHLASPHVGFNSFLAGGSSATARIDGNSMWRRRESTAITKRSQLVSGPLIVAGDFNTPADSDIFRMYWSSYADAFSERGVGFGYTFYAHRSQIRIDHILVGEGWRVRDCRIGPGVGSPHRPLIADLDLMEVSRR